MDINALEEAREAEEIPVRVEIVDKAQRPMVDDDGNPSFLMVRGDDSKAVRDAVRSISALLIDQGKTRMEGEDAMDSRVKKALAAITGWGGWTMNGEPAEFTPENVERLLGFGFILLQVEKAMREHSVFFAAQSTS